MTTAIGKGRAHWLRMEGDKDAKAGRPIENFYSLPVRHGEAERAQYEIGYRAAKKEIMKQKPKDRMLVTELAELAEKSAKKKRNDENTRQVIDQLIAAGYRAGKAIAGCDGEMLEFWTGPGAAPVVILQIYARDDGFELWVPVSQSNRMDETLAALKKAILKGECR